MSFQQRSVAGSEAREEGHVCLAASSHAIIGPGEPAMHELDRELDGAGRISVLRMRDLADVYAMSLGGSRMVEAAALALFVL